VLAYGAVRSPLAQPRNLVGGACGVRRLYVIRTSLTEGLSAEEAVRHYKALSQVERAFRSIKTMDLEVRPIHHYQEQRVRAHLLHSMLAYCLKWHMMEAWRPLLFADEDQEAKLDRDPVAPAERSAQAIEKVSSKRLPDGSPVQSFQYHTDIAGKVCIPSKGTSG